MQQQQNFIYCTQEFLVFHDVFHHLGTGIFCDCILNFHFPEKMTVMDFKVFQFVSNNSLHTHDKLVTS